MDRMEAIKWIKSIQNGGFNKHEIEVPRGEIAVMYWEDGKFDLGMEYGAIIALMKAFDISKEDLCVITEDLRES